MRALRAFGSLLRHGPTTRSIAALPVEGAGSCVRFAASAARLSPSKARRPVNISNRMAPKLNRSLRASAGRPCTTSGAVYGVIALADPSAAGNNSTPPATSARFAGVTAPCAFPASRSLLNASASCSAYRSASATGKASFAHAVGPASFVSFSGMFSVIIVMVLGADSSRPIRRSVEQVDSGRYGSIQVPGVLSCYPKLTAAYSPHLLPGDLPEELQRFLGADLPAEFPRPFPPGQRQRTPQVRRAQQADQRRPQVRSGSAGPPAAPRFQPPPAAKRRWT